MSKERVRTAIVADSDTRDMREMIKEILEKDNFEVVCLSRLKPSRVKTELDKAKPKLVLITARLWTKSEEEELKGIVRLMKRERHLPNALIIVRGPKRSDFQMDEMRKIGVDGWIGDEGDIQFLPGILDTILTRWQEKLKIAS